MPVARAIALALALGPAASAIADRAAATSSNASSALGWAVLAARVLERFWSALSYGRGMLLASQQGRLSTYAASRHALCAGLAAVILAGAAVPLAQGARVADAHLIDVASAERAVHQAVRGYASRAAASFSETRSFRTRSEEAVACRRVAQHRAACSWQALVYLTDDEPGVESPWMVCTGRATVQAQGRRLRVDLRGSGCAH